MVTNSWILQVCCSHHVSHGPRLQIPFRHTRLQSWVIWRFDSEETSLCLLLKPDFLWNTWTSCSFDCCLSCRSSLSCSSWSGPPSVWSVSLRVLMGLISHTLSNCFTSVTLSFDLSTLNVAMFYLFIYLKPKGKKSIQKSSWNNWIFQNLWLLFQVEFMQRFFDLFQKRVNVLQPEIQKSK